ncbi:hypothetical protein SUDANB54_06180 [Streptomyces sp. enrichment culture]
MGALPAGLGPSWPGSPVNAASRRRGSAHAATGTGGHAPPGRENRPTAGPPGRQHRPRRGHPERRVRPRRDRYRRARPRRLGTTPPPVPRRAAPPEERAPGAPRPPTPRQIPARTPPGAWEPPHRRSPGGQHRPRRGHPERRHSALDRPGSPACAARAARNGPPASPQAHGAARQGHTEPVGRHHVTNLAVGQRLVRPAHLIPAPHTAVRLRSAPDGAGCSRPCAAHGPGAGAAPRPRTSEWREPAADGRGDTARPPAGGTAGRGGGASCPAQGVRDPAGVTGRVSASRQLTEPRLGAPVQPAATPPLTRPPAASPTVSARAQPTPRACVPGCGGGRGPVRWRRAPCGVRCRGPS